MTVWRPDRGALLRGVAHHAWVTALQFDAFHHDERIGESADNKQKTMKVYRLVEQKGRKRVRELSF